MALDFLRQLWASAGRHAPGTGSGGAQSGSPMAAAAGRWACPQGWAVPWVARWAGRRVRWMGWPARTAGCSTADCRRWDLAAGICSPAHPSRSPARHARAASSRSRARRTRSSFVGRERALGSTATCARGWSGPTTRRGRLPDGHPHHVRARRSRAGDGVTSPVMVPTLQDRAGQLAALGWTGHEAEWLALVALHSGVFTQSVAKVHHDSRRPPAAWRAVDRPCAPGVVVRPAGAAGEPSRRDTYGRERPHRRGKGSDTA